MPRPLVAAATVLFIALTFWSAVGVTFYDKVEPYFDSLGYQRTYLSIIDDYDNSGLSATGRALQVRDERNLLYPILTGLLAPVLPRSIAGLYLISYSVLGIAFAIVGYSTYRLTRSSWAALFMVLFLFSFAAFDHPRGGVIDQRIDVIAGMMVLATCLAIWLLAEQPERTRHWAFAGIAAGLCLLQRPVSVTQFTIFAAAVVVILWARYRRNVQYSLSTRNLLSLLVPLALASIPLLRSADLIRTYYTENNVDVGTADSVWASFTFALATLTDQIGLIPLTLIATSSAWTVWRRQWREVGLMAAAGVAGAGVFVATASGSNPYPLLATAFLSVIVVIAALRVVPEAVVRAGVLGVSCLALWNAVQLTDAVHNESGRGRNDLERVLVTLSAELPETGTIHGVSGGELGELLGLDMFKQDTTLRSGRNFGHPDSFGLPTSAGWDDATIVAVTAAANAVCRAPGAALLLPSKQLKDDPTNYLYVRRHVEEIGAIFRAQPCVGEELLHYTHRGVEWEVLRLLPPYAVVWSASLPSSLSVGQLTAVPVTVTNSGAMVWAAEGTNPVRVLYRWHEGACGPKVPRGKQIAVSEGTNLPADVPPGATVTVAAIATAAPAQPGTYCLVYDLHQRGVTWFSVKGAAMLVTTITVTP